MTRSEWVDDAEQPGRLLRICLEPTRYLNCAHPAIRARVAALTAGLDAPVAKARALFYFVRDEVRYDMAPDLSTPDDWQASHVLEVGRGFCQQKASLLTALARAAGIPAVICIQAVRDHRMLPRVVEFLGSNVLYPHGLSALWLEGRWVRLDASLDKRLCERAGLPPMEFPAPGADTLMVTHDLAGQQAYELLEDLGLYQEMPEWAVQRVLGSHFATNPDWIAVVHKKGASA